jgi:hypothetical protein
MVRVVVVLLCLSAIVAAQDVPALAVVENTLPVVEAGTEIHVQLHAQGGVPPYRWSKASGDLPEGISLTPEGVLAGRAAKAGVAAFTVTVEDSGLPSRSINKELRIQITASLVLEWLQPPRVHGDRIEGIAQVSNGANDDFDLTVIIVGINDVGRATALGYEHVTLKAGVSNLRVPFGSSLPRGAYMVHADAIAEIAMKNMILRRQLQTPAPLPVTQGP